MTAASDTKAAVGCSVGKNCLFLAGLSLKLDVEKAGTTPRKQTSIPPARHVGNVGLSGTAGPGLRLAIAAVASLALSQAAVVSSASAAIDTPMVAMAQRAPR